MNVTNFIPMDPLHLASSSSRTCMANSQFSNMYYLFQNDPRRCQFPIDYGIPQPYQQPYVFNSNEPFIPSQLMNHSILGYPPQVAGLPQTQLWPSTIHSTNSEGGFRLPKTESISTSVEAPTTVLSQSNGTSNREKNVPKRKKKSKRTIQEHLPKKDWKKEDADLALKTELQYGIAKKKQQIIIKFPDEELNADVVKQFHPGIKFVHFQTSCGPRYCFAQIEESVDINSVIENLKEIKFQNGYLKAEQKLHKEEEAISAEEIDPYTLYLGNLPQNVTSRSVKEKFEKASRIDIGFAQKIKFTRYAFIRFRNVYDAIEAYKDNLDMIVDNRSAVLRFRRIKIKEMDAIKTKKIKIEEDPMETESTESFEETLNKASEKSTPLCDIMEENSNSSTPPPLIKTEKNKGYADEIENGTSSLQPIFETLLDKDSEDYITKYLKSDRKTDGAQVSPESSLMLTNEKESHLTKFISRVTGVSGISTNDAELFKTIVLKLADIFNNSKLA